MGRKTAAYIVGLALAAVVPLAAEPPALDSDAAALVPKASELDRHWRSTLLLAMDDIDGKSPKIRTEEGKPYKAGLVEMRRFVAAGMGIISLATYKLSSTEKDGEEIDFEVSIYKRAEQAERGLSNLTENAASKESMEIGEAGYKQKDSGGYQMVLFSRANVVVTGSGQGQSEFMHRMAEAIDKKIAAALKSKAD